MFSVIRKANVRTDLTHRICVLWSGAIAGAALVAFPAGAQALGGRYRAYTTVTHEGRDARITIVGPTTFALAPQYSNQTIPSGPSVNASSDDTHGGTVTATVTMVYDTRLDNPLPPATYITRAQADAEAIYQFSLEGPSSTAWIPVLLRASGSATNLAAAYFSFVDSEGEYYQDAFDTFGVGTPPYSGGSFDVNRLLYLKTGRLYQINMTALAFSDWYRVSKENTVDEAGAFVDPVLTIQGDDAALYHFVGLPASAIGTAAVPEPASWALWVSGFGLIGGAFRRRAVQLRAA